MKTDENKKIITGLHFGFYKLRLTEMLESSTAPGRKFYNWRTGWDVATYEKRKENWENFRGGNLDLALLAHEAEVSATPGTLSEFACWHGHSQQLTRVEHTVAITISFNCSIVKTFLQHCFMFVKPGMHGQSC